ncbi:MAG TPA: DMT family protein, partial [Chitinophagaceae bacterium]
WKAILVSWGIAFFEYCLMVPANRIGYADGLSGFQLKIIQEVITLVVFAFFAVLYLKEPFHWKYLVSFMFLLGAVYFMFKK